MNEERLIGWLCIMRCLEDGARLAMPDEVLAALRSKGWATCEDDGSDFDFTSAGRAVFDLHAADWGIDALALEDA